MIRERARERGRGADIKREVAGKGHQQSAGGEAVRGKRRHIGWSVWCLHVFFSKIWLGGSSADQITEILPSEPQQNDGSDDGARPVVQPHLSATMADSRDGIPDEDAAVVINSTCSDVDMSSFGKGMECGVPLSEPCFDFERCRNGSSAGIYVYDGICTLANSSILLASQETDLDRWTQESDNLDSVLRSEVEGAGLLAQTYESACLFVAATSRYTPCAVEQPLWNDGTNHVMVSLGDVGR